jgi:hypothetical protein
MGRLLKLCSLSLLIYFLLNAFVLDRPLSLGVLRLELLQKTARLAALPSPKLVILAGSNGPYSHSCVVLSAMLGMPCENAGIAVGIGLDDIFTRYEPLLHEGDVVYMPMELQQYTAAPAAYDAAVDGAFLLRHDRQVLTQLPPDRVLGAGFCCTLADILESLLEMPLARAGLIDPAHLLDTEYNQQGDRVDNDLAKRNQALLATAPRQVPSPGQIDAGYGTALLAGFVARESRKGIVIIGGMPVDYDSAEMPDSVIAAIAAIYRTNGGMFMVLPNRSHYPRADFFNGEDHLAEPCQYLHSIYVAQGLAEILQKPRLAPANWVLRVAATCPSARAELQHIR